MNAEPALPTRRSCAGLLALAFALSAAVVAPAVALAHGVSQQVERRGDAWAVRVRYHGGKPLADATFQVLRPGKPEVVAQEGRTPADGWVVFAPDVPGTWRVRIADDSGHGKVIAVEVAAPVRAAPAAAASAPDPVAISTGPLPPVVTITEERQRPRPADGGGAAPDEAGPPGLRAAAGAAIIAGVFLALALLRRRRGAGR